MKSFGCSASGLQCSWGSDLDTRIPRPKMPKQALPESVRRNLGFNSERKGSRRFSSDKFVIAQEVHRTKGGQEAKAYLKMKSGVPMSVRTSGLVQMQGRQPLLRGNQGRQQLHQQQQQLAVFKRRNSRDTGKGCRNENASLPMRELSMGEIQSSSRLTRKKKFQGISNNAAVKWR